MIPVINKLRTKRLGQTGAADHCWDPFGFTVRKGCRQSGLLAFAIEEETGRPASGSDFTADLCQGRVDGENEESTGWSVYKE